jgi:mannose-6-phosphate isomerase-like protein (cupin superfamily)
MEMAPASPSERTYFILSGSMRVKGKSEEYLLEPGDMLYIGPGEEREIQVPGTEPCTVLLSIAKLD